MPQTVPERWVCFIDIKKYIYNYDIKEKMYRERLKATKQVILLRTHMCPILCRINRPRFVRIKIKLI